MPTQHLSATAIVEGESYSVTSIEMISDNYNTANEVTVNLMTDTSVTEIADAEDVSIIINDTLVFTGTADKIKSTGPLGIEIIAYDAVKKLKNAKIDNTYTNTKVETILEDVFEKADVDYIISIPESAETTEHTNPAFEDELPNHVEDADESVTVQRAPERAQIRQDLAEQESDTVLDDTYTDRPGSEILDRMAERVDAVWYVDPANRVIFTTTPNSIVHKLGNPTGVLDTSAGKRGLPYQSVEVVSTSATNNSPFTVFHNQILGSMPIRAKAGEGEPVYRIETDNIYTYTEALNVANSVYSELQQQQAGGWVLTVGNPEIRVMDVIEMPDHMGAEQYLVSEVEHVLNAEDGFETTIRCGGLVSIEVDGNRMWSFNSDGEDVRVK